MENDDPIDAPEEDALTRVLHDAEPKIRSLGRSFRAFMEEMVPNDAELRNRTAIRMLQTLVDSDASSVEIIEGMRMTLLVLRGEAVQPKAPEDDDEDSL